jgi:hypothetical protein
MEGDSPLPIIELLSRHRKEWLAIAAHGQLQGWSWVNRIVPAQKEMSHASA